MSDDSDFLVREAYHRCSNDLQLVVSMIQLTANRCDDERARQALNDVASRVRVLAHARTALVRAGHQELATVLREVCEALQVLGEADSVTVALSLKGDAPGLSEEATTTAGLAVNELVTNSIKHAFEKNKGGQVTVTLVGAVDGWIIIKVDDDGRPLPKPSRATGERPGLGLDLTRRLLAAQGGTLITPPQGSKCFELRLPAEQKALAA